MPPSPSPSASGSDPSPNPLDSTPKTDHKLLVVVVILAIAGAFIVGYIIHLTLRVKRLQKNLKNQGPFTGRAMAQTHPAAQISPFALGGPHSGMTTPRFRHTPGEDMRIAIRQPDGAWYFADSRVPFTPSGIKELDVVPSPISSRFSRLSAAYPQPPPPPPSQEKPSTRTQSSLRAQSYMLPASSPPNMETKVPIVKGPTPTVKPRHLELQLHQKPRDRLDYDDRDYDFPTPPSPAYTTFSYGTTHRDYHFNDPPHRY